MATISFRTHKGKKSIVPIYITFRDGRDCVLEMKSGIFVQNASWITKGKTKNTVEFANQLEVQGKMDKLRATVSAELNNTTEYTKDWFKAAVDKHYGIVPEVKNTEPTLVEMVDRYIHYVTNQVKVTRKQGTTKTYELTKMRIEKYNAYKSHTHLVSEVGVLFKDEFINWARSVEKYSMATYLKTAKQIKTVIRYAKRMGLTVDESLLKDEESLEMPKKKKGEKLPKPIFLNRSEIDRLMKFEGPDYLENARDWLVVSCWTACRVSDLMELTADDIHITKNGDRIIRYTQEKTGDVISLPIHYQLAQILAKHGGHFPRPISDQNYNRYLKELCKRIGMTEKVKGAKQKVITINGKQAKRSIQGVYPKFELIVSHIGRRSFATNYYGIIPTNLLMMVTGHDTLEDFLVYIGEEPTEHVSLIYKFFKEEEEAAAAI